MPLPVTVGLQGSAATLEFLENSFDGTARIAPPAEGRESELELRFIGGMLRAYVAVGDLPSVLERHSGLTGRHPLPPRWALGYQQSRWGYSGTEELAEVLAGFAQRGIPLSALHLDIDYMDRYRVFSVDEERFGGLADLARAAEAQGCRLVTIVDPGIARDEDDPTYQAALEGEHLVREEDGALALGTVWPGWAVFPDFTASRTREWWSGLYATLLDHGVRGIWHDMNEPTAITLSGDRSISRSARHDFDGRGGDHREAHNVYGLLMDRAGREGLERLAPGRRPFIVSRSGWVGVAREAWIWTADVEATPAGLAQQIPTFLGMGLSGVAFVGSDIGGFSGIPSGPLYLRWLELGILSPFARTHSVRWVPAREPWCFDAATSTQVGRLIALRYRLLPYLYTVAATSSATGWPFLRPLAFGLADPDDEIATCEDALMVGDDLLFAQLVEEALDSIRAAGGRATATKRHHLELLAGRQGHLTAEEITELLQEESPDLAASTVYRILEELERIGLVEHSHAGKGAAAYHLRRAAHGHLLCQGCGAMAEVDPSLFAELVARARREHGFEVDPHHFAVLGDCAECRARAQAPAGSREAPKA